MPLFCIFFSKKIYFSNYFSNFLKIKIVSGWEGLDPDPNLGLDLENNYGKFQDPDPNTQDAQHWSQIVSNLQIYLQISFFLASLEG